MKKVLFILLFVFILIGINEIRQFNNETQQSIKALNDTVQACTIDMQKDKNIICD